MDKNNIFKKAFERSLTSMALINVNKTKAPDETKRISFQQARAFEQERKVTAPFISLPHYHKQGDSSPKL